MSLQYLSNAFILFKTFFYVKLNFLLKIYQKTCTFENLEEVSQKLLATLPFKALKFLTQGIYNFLDFKTYN